MTKFHTMVRTAPYKECGYEYISVGDSLGEVIVKVQARNLNDNKEKLVAALKELTNRLEVETIS